MPLSPCQKEIAMSACAARDIRTNLAGKKNYLTARQCGSIEAGGNVCDHLTG